LFHIGVAAHVYGLALGQGDTMGYEAECETCRIVISTHQRCYSRVATDSNDTVETVLERCRTTRTEKLIAQLAHAERLRAGQLTAEERATAMRDAFEFLNEYAKLRRTHVTMDVKGKDGCLNSVIGFGIVYLAWLGWNSAFPKLPVEGKYTFILFSAALAVGFGYTLWVIATDTRRYVQAELLPKLASALSPMRPTEGEIRALLERYLKRKFTLARNLHVAQVVQAITQISTRP
jgi:hypothetical protein